MLSSRAVRSTARSATRRLLAAPTPSLSAAAGTTSSQWSSTTKTSSSIGGGSCTTSSQQQQQHRFFSADAHPERTQKFQELGLLDAEGLTVFETLHEMQVNSCQVYADNELFGTYAQESAQFEYMTYKEYDDKVTACRKVLQDLGT